MNNDDIKYAKEELEVTLANLKEAYEKVEAQISDAEYYLRNAKDSLDDLGSALGGLQGDIDLLTVEVAQ